MNRDIIILREAITKIVPMIAGRGLRVTQMGTGAYVKADPRTGIPIVVNIPSIPDNATPEFVVAIQGFIDHEVSHVLYTDFTFKAREKSRRLHSLHNIMEDTRIERVMANDFPGSKRNLAQLRSYFVQNITKPAVENAESQEEAFGYLTVVAMRALAGHAEMQNFMDDNGYWKHPLVDAMMQRMPDALKKRIPLLASTADAFDAAVELEKILYPPPPPAPPQPQPPEEKDEQDSDQQPGDSDSDSDQKDQTESDGQSEDQEDADGSADESDDKDEDAEAGETGDGEDEEDHSDEEQSSDDGEGQGEREHDDEKDNENASGGDEGEPEEDKEEDAGEGESEGSGKGEEDADDENDGDASQDSDDDGDQSDGSEEDAGEKDGDAEENGDGQPGEDQPGDDESGAEEGEADDADDQSSSGSQADDDNDGDPDDADASGAEADQSGEQDETGEDETSGTAGEPEEDEADGDVDDSDASSAGDADGDDADGESEEGDDKADLNVAVEVDTDDEEQNDSGDAGEPDGGDIAGVGYSGPNPFAALADEHLEEVDLSSSIAILIQRQAIDACEEAEYTVFTREFDIIAPLPVPKEFPQSYVTSMEEQTRKMTGVMQKDIERMMAAQSRVFNVGGRRSGKLNGPGLHRILANDARIFSKREEIKAKDTAVTLLVDCSGSMRNAKQATAMSAAFALATTLERVNIPSEVLGFTTGSIYCRDDQVFDKSKFAELEAALKAEYHKSGVRFCRTDPIYMPIFKDFNERLQSDVKKRFAYMRSMQPNQAQNIDGESLEYAAMRLAKRPEKRKVILVLSDGHPAGARNDDEHLRMMTTKLTKGGYDLVGIGIEDNAVSRFYDNFLVLKSVEELPGAVMGELRKILSR
jgi:cobalamin biosynthesis protein CobT